MASKAINASDSTVMASYQTPYGSWYCVPFSSETYTKKLLSSRNAYNTYDRRLVGWKMGIGSDQPIPNIVLVLLFMEACLNEALELRGCCPNRVHSHPDHSPELLHRRDRERIQAPPPGLALEQALEQALLLERAPAPAHAPGIRIFHAC